jgi:hypothetical protein
MKMYYESMAAQKKLLQEMREANQGREAAQEPAQEAAQEAVEPPVAHQPEPVARSVPTAWQRTKGWFAKKLGK